MIDWDQEKQLGILGGSYLCWLGFPQARTKETDRVRGESQSSTHSFEGNSSLTCISLPLQWEGNEEG